MITDIIFDLHGVLADPRSVGRNYEHYLVEALAFTGLPPDRIARLHATAFKRWIAAFREVNSGHPWTEEGLPRYMDEARRIDREWEACILQDIPDTHRARASKVVNTPTLEYEAMARGTCPAFYPEVEPALRDLKTEGYRLHVASSASDNHVRGTLALHHVEGLFNGIIGYDTVQAPKKASNGIYFTRMLSVAGIDPAYAVFVGDGFEEAALAMAQGLRFILIDRSSATGIDHSAIAGFPVLPGMANISKVIKRLSRDT